MHRVLFSLLPSRIRLSLSVGWSKHRAVLCNAVGTELCGLWLLQGFPQRPLQNSRVLCLNMKGRTGLCPCTKYIKPPVLLFLYGTSTSVLRWVPFVIVRSGWASKPHHIISKSVVFIGLLFFAQKTWLPFKSKKVVCIWCGEKTKRLWWFDINE